MSWVPLPLLLLLLRISVSGAPDVNLPSIDIDALLHGVEGDYNSTVWAFANATSAFVKCIVIHSQPLTMCQGCLQPYLRTNATFEAFEDDDLDKLSEDRVQVIANVHQRVLDLWAKANCDNCFDITPPSENSSYIFTVKNEALDVEQCYNETYHCISEHNKTICHANEKNETVCYNEGCKNCSRTYKHLNEKYDRLVDKYGRPNICMDVVDMVNKTRQLWSRVLRCNHVELNTTLLFIVIPFVCLLPVFFYLSARIQSEEHLTKIIPQKRLATSRSFASLSVN